MNAKGFATEASEPSFRYCCGQYMNAKGFATEDLGQSPVCQIVEANYKNSSKTNIKSSTSLGTSHQQVLHLPSMLQSHRGQF